MPLINHGNDNEGPPTQASSMAMRVRRLFAMERDNALAAADRIHRAVVSGGRGNVDTELGDDAAELVTAYAALKSFILTLDPDAEVPDLPES